MPDTERPDLIAMALQELPHVSMRFHTSAVQIVGEALSSTHRVFCWVRKWSQMMIIFIRRRLSLYASLPEYQFVASSVMTKPFRTKGAIGICFRLLQTTVVFVACHLTHGKLRSRILDYHKISRSFDFPYLRGHATLRPFSRSTFGFDLEMDYESCDGLSDTSSSLPLKKAAHVFWFGDLNFRVLHTSLAGEITRVGKRLNSRLFRKDLDYLPILQRDELNAERSKGLIFEGFQEATIRFPPTHKFLANSNSYAPNRVPSYTDRVLSHFIPTVLYWSRSAGSLMPLRYDCVWEMGVSDHKPVYCTFQMCVVDALRPRPLLNPSSLSPLGCNTREAKQYRM